jgi:hypothetical protein
MQSAVEKTPAFLRTLNMRKNVLSAHSADIIFLIHAQHAYIQYTCIQIFCAYLA